MIHQRISALIMVALLAASTLAASAAVPVGQPDAGSILRDIGDKPKALPERPPERPLKTEPAPPALLKGPKVMVKGFHIIGATLFSEAELQGVLAEFIDRDLDFAELSQAAQRIAAYYTTKGFMAQVMLPPQDVKDGIIVIQVLEGKLGAVEVTPLRAVRFSEQRVKSFITGRQPVGQPIRIEAIEEGLMLLNDNPGIIASANLQAGAEPGTTDLLVKLDRSQLVTGGLLFDNNGSVSTGEYRLTADLNINNTSGIGDQVSLKGLSTIGSNYGRIAYSVPLGTGGSRLGANFSYLHYELGGDFESLDANGNALTTGMTLSTPLIHKRSGNLYSTVGYEYRAYVNSAHGSETSNKKNHVGTIGMSGDWYDAILGGGYTAIAITTTIGGLDLSGNASDQATDLAGPRTEGTYSKFSYNLSRLQKIYGDRTSLQISLNGQFAGDNLDSSEKISLGGPNAVRALPPNEGSGDEGFILTAELRQNLADSIQLFGFYDFGWVRQHHTLYDSWYTVLGAPNTYDTDGVGLGLSWAKPGLFNIKGTVAQRLGRNPATTSQGKDSDGTLREPRFWLQASLYF